ncbi:MAG: glutathione S-transferase family protein [Steroidobacteraceae bacterium]
MTITITAFERSPDGGKGLARDTRVRWALEEVHQPYAVRLVSFRALKQPAHLSRQPFGQIPTYEEGDRPWAEERLPLVMDRARVPLAQLSARLGEADWLDGVFTAGDLMMVSVLLQFRSSGLLGEFPNFAAYLARGELRPAYQRAFADQLAINAV